MSQILTADIGGTKTVLALAEAGQEGIELGSIKRYESRNYKSFETLLKLYLEEHASISASSLSIAVAGPVIDNRCEPTNLEMEIDCDAINEKFGFERIFMVNDLVAAGYGLEVAPGDGLEILYDGRGDGVGNRVLISPGTGLGETIIHFTDNRYIPIASEGGHADFAPYDGTTERLWSYLKRVRRRVSAEDVLSGPGIFNIFQFLVSENGVDLGEEFKNELSSEPAKKITSLAIEKNDPVAIRTVELFLDVLAAEAGNMALKAMASGGVYLGGGIIPSLLSLLDKKRLVSVFADKGVHRPLLELFPVYAVTDTRLPLYGAANYCLLSRQS